MRVTTESGSVYEISEHGICVKTNSDGYRVDAFKAMTIKAVPDSASSWEDIYNTPDGDPVVGQRMYISGLNTWWLTTPVVKVEWPLLY